MSVRKVILFLFSVGILFGIFSLIYIRIILPQKPIKDTDWLDVQYLMEDVDCKIYYYGDMLCFPENFRMETIDQITIENIDLNHDHVYMIVNDWESKTMLTEMDVDVIKTLSNNSNFNFIYLGYKMLPYFSETIREFTFSEDDLYFAYVMSGGVRTVALGGFTRNDLSYISENKYIPADSIIMDIAHLVRMNQ